MVSVTASDTAATPAAAGVGVRVALAVVAPASVFAGSTTARENCPGPPPAPFVTWSQGWLADAVHALEGPVKPTATVCGAVTATIGPAAPAFDAPNRRAAGLTLIVVVGVAVSVSPRTCTGVLRSIVVLSPNCPFALKPQVQTEPSDLIARLWYPRPPSDVTAVKMA